MQNLNRRAGSEAPLSDEELARLLGDDLGPSERAALLERLANDPAGQQILALAASQMQPTGEGLPPKSVDRLLGIVRETPRDLGICPFCAGDLNPTGDFCPHCGNRVTGSLLSCARCGKPLREDSVYCPHCGSSVRPIERKSAMDTSFFLLVLGLIVLLLAFLYRPLLWPSLVIGCLAIGMWAGDLLHRGGKTTRAVEMSEKETAEEKQKQQKSG